MSYICCCGRKCAVEVFKVKNPEKYLAVFVSELKSCPVCRAYVVEIRRYTAFGRLLVVRKSGKKAKKLFAKIKFELCKITDYERVLGEVSTLNYNEFGKIKKCHSNLSGLSIGRFESLALPEKPCFLSQKQKKNRMNIRICSYN